MLGSLELKGIYRTDSGSLIEDFYIPCLSVAKSYDRAVGFFSSSMLIEAAYGISGLIKNNGKMRLIIGHPLSDADYDAVIKGEKIGEISFALHQKLVEILENAGAVRTVQSIDLLSWMVATKCIEIKFGFRKVGMYHEKIGVIRDEMDGVVVFHGSANESANALLPTRNFESLAVYPNWKEDVFKDYGLPLLNGFESLWNNKTDGITTMPVPSEFYKRIIDFRGKPSERPSLSYEVTGKELVEDVAVNCLPRLPKTINGTVYELKAHQRSALSAWAANDYSGIMALATGAGKTVTALHAATNLVKGGYPIALIVAVPYQILGEQWF